MRELAAGYSLSVDSVDDRQWAELLGLFEDATVYQTMAFGRACWDPKQLSHLVLRRGSEVVAVCQVRVIRMPGVGGGIGYVRWGPLCRRKGQEWSGEAFRQALIALEREYAVRRRLLLRVTPNVYAGDAFAEDARAVLESMGWQLNESIRPYRTMRVDLGQTLEQLRKGLQGRWRSYLKSAEGAELTVTVTETEEDYDRFTVLYGEMMDRKRFETAVDVEEFREVQRQLLPGRRMRVLVCSRDGVPLNSLVVTTGGDTGIYLLAATGHAGMKERGAYLLQWRAMEMLKAEGVRWYDLGGVNPESNPGVFQFKNGLGGHEVFQFGRYELCHSGWSRFAVRTGERLSAAVKDWKRRRRAKSEAKTEEPAKPDGDAGSGGGSPASGGSSGGAVGGVGGDGTKPEAVSVVK